MRRALNNFNDDLVKQYPDYVCRITSDEGTIGKGYLSKFQELETVTPVIVTTSQLLTTGVDIPTCKNIVIARVVSSMVEFKQIIGRGTRRSAVVDDLPEPMAFASYMIRLRFDSSTVMPTYAQRMLRHLRISGQLFDFARTTAGSTTSAWVDFRPLKSPFPRWLSSIISS